MIAFLFSTIYLLILSVAQPYKFLLDDHFAKVCNVLLIVVFFFSLVLQYATFSEQVDSVLTPQLRSRFSFDAVIVTAGMMLSILGALVLAAVIGIWQTVVAASLPVIRLTDTKAAPDLLMAVGHDWHMFLSHVWGTGQEQVATIKRQLLHYIPGVKVFLDVDEYADCGLDQNPDPQRSNPGPSCTYCICSTHELGPVSRQPEVHRCA